MFIVYSVDQPHHAPQFSDSTRCINKSSVTLNLEQNPLALGTVWNRNGLNVDVRIFGNKEDYQKWVKFN